MNSIVQEATKDGLPVSLTVLRPNPAKQLYERLGFQLVNEDDARFFMTRPLGG